MMGEISTASVAARYYARQAAARAEQARRDAERAREHRRREWYEAARRALARGGDVELPMLFAARHVVDLAIAAGVSRIVYLPPHSRAWTLTRGQARGRVIVIPPTRSVEGYLTALHEIGHVADPHRHATTLGREIAAWRWAMARSCIWTPAAFEHLRAYLQTYIDAEPRDVEGIIAAEMLIAEARTQRTRIPAGLDAFEAQVFAEQYGPKTCRAKLVCEGGTPAVALIGARFCCVACRPLLEARDAIRRGRSTPEPPAVARTWCRTCGRRIPEESICDQPRCREAFAVDAQLAALKRERQEHWPDRGVVSALDTREQREEQQMEHATVVGNRGALAAYSAVNDGLNQLALGELKCSTCGGRAVKVHRALGQNIGTCAAPACVENANMDRALRALRVARGGR